MESVVIQSQYLHRALLYRPLRPVVTTILLPIMTLPRPFSRPAPATACVCKVFPPVLFTAAPLLLCPSCHLRLSAHQSAEWSSFEAYMSALSRNSTFESSRNSVPARRMTLFHKKVLRFAQTTIRWLPAMCLSTLALRSGLSTRSTVLIPLLPPTSSRCFTMVKW